MSVFQVVRPSLFTVALGLVGLAGSLLGLALGVSFGLDAANHTTGTALSNGLFAVALFGGGPLFAALSLAGLLERRSLARALPFAGAGLVATLSSISIATGLGMDVGLGTGIASGVLCCGAPALVTFALAGWMGLSGLRSLKADLDKIRAERLVGLLAERRSATFEELASELRVAPERVEGLMRSVEKRIGGELVLTAKAWVCTSLARGGRTQLLGMIEARGRATESDLATELGIPPHLVRTWVYELAGSGRFKGSVHWPDVWAAASGRAESRDCPSCGGKMEAAGRSRLVCGHCGTEGFVEG